MVIVSPSPRHVYLGRLLLHTGLRSILPLNLHNPMYNLVKISYVLHHRDSYQQLYFKTNIFEICKNDYSHITDT